MDETKKSEQPDIYQQIDIKRQLDIEKTRYASREIRKEDLIKDSSSGGSVLDQRYITSRFKQQ